MALTNLGLTTAANEACISLGAGLARILPFAHSLNAEAARRGEVVKVPVYATEAAEFNANTNNYAQNTDVIGVDVPVDKHPVAGFEATDVQLTQSDVNFFADGGRAAARAIARKMNKDFFGLVTANLTGANTTTTPTTKAGWTDLYAVASEDDIDPGNAALVLSSTQYAKVLGLVGDAAIVGTDALASGVFKGGFAGFSYIIGTPYLATGVDGFIAERGALAFGGRGIEVDESAYKQVGTVSDEHTGAPITLMQFTKPETGVSHITATNLYGVKVLDPKHITIIKAA
jgi:hypothetical protein